MKIFLIIILIAGIIALSAEIYFLSNEKEELNAAVGDLRAKVNSIIDENEDLKAEIDYFSHPENLEKELKSKFNYKEAGEKFYIIVP